MVGEAEEQLLPTGTRTKHDNHVGKVDDRGREHAAVIGRTGDPAIVSPGDGITQQDIKDFSDDL